MYCIELLLKIYTRQNGCIISDIARNNGTPEEGKAIWIEQIVGGDRRLQQVQKHAAVQKSSESWKEEEPARKEIWIMADRKGESLHWRNKQGGKRE